MLGEMWQFRGRYKILHITWFAFFLSFVVWFNFPPLATTVKADLGLTTEQIRTIAICNVALTVPARIIIGMLLDKFGPRLTYSLLLMYAAIPCIMFASAQTFSQLVISRLLMGIVGAGFVIGIRMVAEWFPPKEIGLAEGIYGGWGNFGSAFSAFTMALIAGWLAFGAPGSGLNWRAAIAGTGIVAALYGVFYLLNAKDTPPGKAYRRPASARGLEVTTKRDFWFLMLMNVPLSAILGLVAWRLKKLGLYEAGTMYLIWGVLLGLY
ncbi:MAG: MFS transporter, partial [Pleurocapsa sp.]